MMGNFRRSVFSSEAAPACVNECTRSPPREGSLFKRVLNRSGKPGSLNPTDPTCALGDASIDNIGLQRRHRMPLDEENHIFTQLESGEFGHIATSDDLTPHSHGSNAATPSTAISKTHGEVACPFEDADRFLWTRQD